MRFIQVAALVLAFAGCRETPLVPVSNARPVADAQFVNAMGVSVDELVSPDPSTRQLPFAGQPVAVTLSGLASKDDGEIMTYRWLSGEVGAAGGPKRGGVDPADIPQPVVTLGEGEHTFVLWVIDDDGIVSEPNSITITVGASDPSKDPAVLACADTVFDMVTDPCKVCVCTSADCRPKVAETTCDAMCWGLLSCIGTMCPDFMTNTGCISDKCMAFVAGGALGAMAAGACVGPCAAMCRPADATAMGTAGAGM